jgi:thiol-disulfide isomerase/thioredoxin
MKKHIGIVVALTLLASAVHAGGEKDAAPAGDSMMAKDAPKPGDSMMMAAAPTKPVFDLTGLSPGAIPFTTEAAAQALAVQKRVVYFFAASWCPTCRETYRDLKASAGSVPADLTIVVVDYDKEAALKSKYGVSYQHTFVSIGGAGEPKKVWSGSTTVADIVAKASAR